VAPGDKQLLYNLLTDELSVLPQKYSVGHAVSPDHTQLALDDYDAKKIDILSANGKIIRSLPMQSNWGWLADWVDNQQIAIVKAEKSDNARYIKYPASVVILDTFTGKMQEFPPDYPNIDIANQGISLGYWGSTVYDPTLTWVVYAGMMSNPPDPMFGSLGYILYSLTKEEILAEIPDQGPRANPIWFPDGKRFVILGRDEFYQVNTHGQIEKLTDLNPDYDIVNNSGRAYLLDYHYSLSPDGNFIAFWQTKYNEDVKHDQLTFFLAILDLTTGVVTDTCIKSGHHDFEILLADPTPIWSPDSKSLVVLANLHEGEGSRNLVLVDLVERAAYELQSSYLPTGWLVVN
jgi:hypothetical protein